MRSLLWLPLLIGIGNAQVMQNEMLGKLPATPPPKKVPVVLAVMSRCPDAQVCEIVFDRVVDRVGGLMDLRLEYIGEIDDKAKYGVECKHGDQECRGNIQQLCARQAWLGVSGDVTPWSDWWQFIGCQNYGSVREIGERRLAEQCAKLVGHNWDEVEECAEGKQGIELLKESVTKVRKMGVEKSCSIIINGAIVCVHDGRWKDCQLDGHEYTDFSAYIRSEWQKLNEPA